MLRFSQSLIGPATAIALAAAVAIPAVGGWQIMRDRSATLDDARGSVRTLGHALAQHAVRVVEEVDLLLADTVELVQSGPDGMNIRPFLQRRATMLSQTHSFGVLNTEGDLVADSGAPHGAINGADRPYFIWHRDHADQGLHIGTVFAARLDGRPGIPLSRRVDHPDGSFAGVAAAAILPEDFQDFYDGLEVGPHGVVALWSQDATLLVRRPKAVGSAETSGLVRSGNAAKFGPEASGVLDATSSVDGIARIVAFERVGTYPLVLSVGLSIDDVLRVWRHESIIQVSVLVVAAIALLCLAFGLERGRRVAQRAALLLQETNQRYRLLAQNASDLVLLKPFSSDRVSYASPSSVDMIGWRPDELSATPITALVHPEDRDRVLGELTTVLAERSNLTSVYRLQHKDGHYIRVEARFQLAAANAEDVNIIIAARDVTARYSAEEQFRMLADSTSDVITQIDLDLTRRYVSPSCLTVLGYTPAAVMGGEAIGPIHPEDRDRVTGIWERLAAGLSPADRVTTTYRVRHAKGHWIWGEAAISLVRDAGSGLPAFLVSSLRDVSERQRAAHHLERAKESAENAARVKSEFVANMSHELRTPLTGILGIHDLLQTDPTLDDRQRRYITMAHDAGRSLLAIVNDVLDFSKIEAGELVIDEVVFDPRSLVRTCLDLGRDTAAKKGLSVEARFATMVPAVLGDPNRLRQILLNLITNALKFTEVGGLVVDAAYDRDASRLRIRVSDTGVGIPPEKIGLLFERFTQADTSITRRYGGTGLGLAISKRLVTLMGGEIGAESELGTGSVFWFELPLAEAVENVAVPRAFAPAGTGTPLHVLLAEDNDVNQDIIAAMLQSRGHRVTTVGDGAAAVEALTKGSGFDVVLMDLQMPVMDGLSATHAIRIGERAASSRPIPILGLTANAMTDDVERCLAGGMDGHIPKPIEWDTLFAAIAKIGRARSGRTVLTSG